MNEIFRWHGRQIDSSSSGLISFIREPSLITKSTSMSKNSDLTIRFLRDRSQTTRSLASDSRVRSSLLQSSPEGVRNDSPGSIPDGLHEEGSSDSEGVKYDEHFGQGGFSPCPFDQTSNSSRDSSPKPENANFWSDSSLAPLPEVPEVVLCFWCKQLCERRYTTHGGTKEGFTFVDGDRIFCSEVCFTRSRGASLKKSKECNWCHQVRSTVSYIDFTDENHQIHFCSRKCLNQYKMHIFCRETEAHLQLHPHLNDLKSNKGGSLITPDLWLNDATDKTVVFSDKSSKQVDVNNVQVISNNMNISNKIAVSKSYDNPSSVSPPSPPNVNDSSEPMNLTTQAKSLNTSQEHCRKSPLLNSKSLKSSEEMKAMSSNRTGRSRNRPKTSSQKNILNKDSGVPFNPIIHEQESSESKSKGTIRVRQLQEFPQRQGLDIPASPPPPSNVSSLGLLMGGHLPLMPGIPSLLSAPVPPRVSPDPPLQETAPPELTPPPLLPQFFLSHPELLRLPGLRPPMLLPQPPPLQVAPQPTPSVLPTPPPHPRLTPQSQRQVPPQENSFTKPFTLPPVTVLLPMPIPLPIPIPVPMPFPVPKDRFNDILHSNSTPVSNSEATAAKTINFRSENREQLQQQQPLLLNALNNSPDIKTESPKLNDLPLRSHSNLETDLVTFPEMENFRTERKERSILNYTSDVHEVNGVYVPKTGNWSSATLEQTLKKGGESESAPDRQNLISSNSIITNLSPKRKRSPSEKHKFIKSKKKYCSAKNPD